MVVDSTFALANENRWVNESCFGHLWDMRGNHLFAAGRASCRGTQIFLKHQTVLGHQKQMLSPIKRQVHSDITVTHHLHDFLCHGINVGRYTFRHMDLSWVVVEYQQRVSRCVKDASNCSRIQKASLRVGWINRTLRIQTILRVPIPILRIGMSGYSLS